MSVETPFTDSGSAAATATFEDRVAVVTGAGTGIGFEIARRLARGGARVLLNDLAADRLAAAVERIAAEGGTCRGELGDIAEVEVGRALIERAERDLGPVRLLAANAGVTQWAPFLDYTPEDFERVVAVNVRGTFFLAQAVARRLRGLQLDGAMVFVSSVAGHVSVQDLSAYGMTKTALEGLARALVVELSPHGIRVNAVAPGSTVTDRNLADQPRYEELWDEVTPLGRTAQPADIADAVVMLLSPAARHVTGQTLVVDGGWSSTAPTPPSHEGGSGG